MDIGRYSAVQALQLIEELLTRLDVAELTAADDEVLVASMRRARKLRGRLDALACVLTEKVDARKASMKQLGTPVTSLIAIDEDLNNSQASGQVTLAKRVASHEAPMRAALDGVISTAQAAAIAKGIEGLPELPVAVVEQVSARFVTRARGVPARELVRLAPQVLAEVAPELALTPDDKALRAERERAQAVRDRHFTWGNNGEGSVWFRGQLPEAEAEPLVRTLTAMVTADKREERDRAKNRRRANLHTTDQPGRDLPDTDLRDADLHATGLRDADLRDAGLRGATVDARGADMDPWTRYQLVKEAEGRTPAQRNADALVELFTAALADHVGGTGAGIVSGERGARNPSNMAEGLGAVSRGRRRRAPRAVIRVTISLADLLERAGAGGVLESGTELTAGQLRRLAADAGIIPFVLGGNSEILDQGRARRLATSEQREALELRDKGCIFPNCGKPPEQCETHHIDPWGSFGESNLHEMALLCRHHHNLVEPDKTGRRDQWRVVYNPDLGRPECLPPDRLRRQPGQLTA